MQLRYELHLLTSIFKKDVADFERPGIPVDHVSYYYQKFFNKPLGLKNYEKDTFAGLVSLVADTVKINEESGLFVSALADDVEPSAQLFVKHAASDRGSRQRRLDAGDDTAKLTFNAQVMTAPKVQQSGLVKPPAPGSAGKTGGKAGGKGSKYGKGGFKGKY